MSICIVLFRDTCLIDYAFHSGSMVNGDAPASTQEECQIECQKDPNCEYWDFDISVSICRLRDAFGNGPEYDLNHVSGAKNCEYSS